MPPSGSVACLRTPVVNSAYERPRRSAIAREIVPDLALELLVEDERPAGDARHELDGAVVVRRAEPAGDEAQVRLEALGECALRDPRPGRRRSRCATGSRPSRTASAARNGPLRSCRSPRTSSEPVTTIAARGRVKRWPG